MSKFDDDPQVAKLARRARRNGVRLRQVGEGRFKLVGPFGGAAIARGSARQLDKLLDIVEAPTPRPAPEQAGFMQRIKAMLPGRKSRE